MYNYSTPIMTMLAFGSPRLVRLLFYVLYCQKKNPVRRTPTFSAGADLVPFLSQIIYKSMALADYIRNRTTCLLTSIHIMDALDASIISFEQQPLDTLRIELENEPAFMKSSMPKDDHTLTCVPFTHNSSSHPYITPTGAS